MLTEIWRFCAARKKPWMFPIIVILIAAGGRP